MREDSPQDSTLVSNSFKNLELLSDSVRKLLRPHMMYILNRLYTVEYFN